MHTFSASLKRSWRIPAWAQCSISVNSLSVSTWVMKKTTQKTFKAIKIILSKCRNIKPPMNSWRIHCIEYYREKILFILLWRMPPPLPTDTHTHIRTHNHIVSGHSFAILLLLTPSIHPSPTRSSRSKAGVQVLVYEDKKKNAHPDAGKTDTKKKKKKCRKENVKLKSEHFLSLWALGPGSEHPWMLESFIIWQPGSAVQFYLLAGGKWRTTRSARSKRESEGSRDKDRDRVSETLSFMQKQPPESFMATHEPFSLYSMLFLQLLHRYLYPLFALFSDALFFSFSPAIKYLPLYNLQ